MTDGSYRFVQSQRPDEPRYTNLMLATSNDPDLPMDHNNLTVVVDSFVRVQDRLTKGVSKMSKASG